MALHDKHQLKFNIHKDSKTLMEAIEKRFGGNKETKKVQKTLLKQQYENFTGSSSESLDQIHYRLQKLISQLEILEESLSQEDINLKFLRSLPTEWRTHTLIWRNKTDLEEQSLDDLFNSLKIYEAEVKSSSSTSISTQNIAFVSSQNIDSTNEPVSAVASAKIPVFALLNVDTLSNAEGILERMDLLPWVLICQRWSATTTIGNDTLQGSVGLLRTQEGMVEEEPTNYALMAFTSSSSSSSDNEPIEQVKTPRPSVKTVETSIPADNHKTAIPKPKSNSNRRNRKACFVCKSLDHLIKDCDFYEKKMAQKPSREHAQRGNHQQYASMTLPNPQKHRPRQAKTVVTKPQSPPRRHINRSPSPKASNFSPTVTAVKASMVNAVKGNMSYLSDFEKLNGGYVAFDGNPKGGKISGKGKIRTGKLDFDDVYFVKELKFNLFSISQMCDKKNSVLFTDTECLVLSPEFKLPDENQVLLIVPKENNMYNVDLKNIVPSEDLTCLFAKETLDESNLWHRRLGHINFKTMNNLVKVHLNIAASNPPSLGYSILEEVDE
nr:ribonuclease H-like domain-containing protein [Tanacetum cinerariifolium]